MARMAAARERALTSAVRWTIQQHSDGTAIRNERTRFTAAHIIDDDLAAALVADANAGIEGALADWRTARHALARMLSDAEAAERPEVVSRFAAEKDYDAERCRHIAAYLRNEVTAAEEDERDGTLDAAAQARARVRGRTFTEVLRFVEGWRPGVVFLTDPPGQPAIVNAQTYAYLREQLSAEDLARFKVVDPP